MGKPADAEPIEAPDPFGSGKADAGETSSESSDRRGQCGEGDGIQITGRIKWFDATRGFGFLVSDQCEGEVLVHFSVLRDHERRSLPEGAIVKCVVEVQEGRLQAR